MKSYVFDIIKEEKNRQRNNIELIASENFVSKNIMKAVGSCLTNKYCEGYPKYRISGKTGRYYGGCQHVDILENYCCRKWREVFNTNYHVNVQPHSGSQANYAAYMSVLKPGDTILAMNLNDGGHLTHGSSVNFSGKMYKSVFYGVDDNGIINYADIYFKMLKYRPNLVVAGASAYPREINFKEIYNIIQKVKLELKNENYDPFFMVDMSHIAGLVATGLHNSPFCYADIITTTTHKTLRGPRGGLIFCRRDLADKVDSAVFPGSQGGPLMHVIAGKAVCAEEVLTKKYQTYMKNVVDNCKAMANEFSSLGMDVVTGGTDNHLLLLDLSRTHSNVTGKRLQEVLDTIGVTLNKNCVPNEKRKPSETSGVRIGTAAMTTKGYKKKDFIRIARVIKKVADMCIE